MEPINLLDACIILLGIYLIVSTINMKKTKKINKMFLAPEEIKKVKNEAGLIDFISPVCFIFGGVITILGFLGILTSTLFEIKYYNWIEMIIFVIVLLIFAERFRRAREEFVK